MTTPIPGLVHRPSLIPRLRLCLSRSAIRSHLLAHCLPCSSTLAFCIILILDYTLPSFFLFLHLTFNKIVHSWNLCIAHSKSVWNGLFSWPVLMLWRIIQNYSELFSQCLLFVCWTLCAELFIYSVWCRVKLENFVFNLPGWSAMNAVVRPWSNRLIFPFFHRFYSQCLKWICFIIAHVCGLYKFEWFMWFIFCMSAIS